MATSVIVESRRSIRLASSIGEQFVDLHCIARCARWDNVERDCADDSYYVVILDRRRDDIAAREAHASLGHTAVYVQY